MDLIARPELLGEIQRIDQPLWTYDRGLSDEWVLPPGQDVLRSEDFLALRVQLLNLRAVHAGNGGAKLDPTRGDAFIILHFPPQAIAEKVFYEVNPNATDKDGHRSDVDGSKYKDPAPPQDKGPETPDAPPIRSRIANWSHLVFRYDSAALKAAGLAEIPYTLAGVLKACLHLPLSIAANARRTPPFVSPRKVVVDRFSAAQQRAVKQMSPALRAQLSAVTLRNQSLMSRHSAEGASLVMRRAELSPLSAGDARPSAKGGLTLQGTGIDTLAALRVLADLVYAVEPIQGVKARIRPKPARPRSTHTALELPYRLILSPNETARWKHTVSGGRFAPTGHSELWHTRLGRADDDGEVLDGPDSGTELRAIWARVGADSDPDRFNADWQAPSQDKPEAPSGYPPPFRMTLDDRDRFNIVHLSGNFALRGGRHESIDCRRLMLSSLGGWLDSRGAWHVPDGLSVEEWVHRATQARDHYVRVVYKGYLFPWGHRVSLVKVSERKFHGDSSGNPAYLRQRMFLVVREFVRDYPAGIGFSDAPLTSSGNAYARHFHRQLPFARVRITTLTTPDIQPPTTRQVKYYGQSMFWPVVTPGAPYRFQMVGTDLDGVECQFEMPAIFIDNEKANPGDELLRAQFFAEACDAWRKASASDRTAPLHRQRIAFAPSRKPGDTVCETETMVFGAESEGLAAGWTANGRNPICLPSMLEAKVRIPALAYLSGEGGNSTLTWNKGYLKTASGFSGGEVFADIAGAALDFSTQGQRSGGFVQPNLVPRALSRLAGPVSGKLDAEAFAAGSFQPDDFFSSLSPLLFGCIPLGELIEIAGVNANELGEAPKFLAETAAAAETFFNDVQRMLALCDTGSAGAADALLGLAERAAKSAFDQAVSLALNELKSRVAVLDASTALTAKNAIENVLSKSPAALDAIVNALRTLEDNPANWGPDFATFQSALANLPAAVTLPANLPTAVKAAAQQIVTEIKTRVAQIQSLIADVQQIPPLLQRAQALSLALAKVIEDADALTSSGDGSGGDKLQGSLSSLPGSIDDVRKALVPIKLLDGAVKQGALSVLDALSKAAEASATLVPLIESLLGDEIVIRFDWKPKVKAWPNGQGPLGALGVLFKPHDERGFIVAVEARAKKSGGAPEAKVSCSLSRFDLILLGTEFGFLELAFDKIEFRAQSSLKMDVDVVFNELRFIGVLSFVETLKDLIPLDGFSDPPALEISEKGIDASFSMALPNIAVGVFSLSNLSLGAGFTVPFIGQPLAVRFNFCTRDQPFNLIVAMFGGGGFFGVTVDPRGVQVLEASFEFGASIAVDLGVASGGVSVMAGIYFRMETDEASLTGYLRMGGHVDVLGIASASIELYLELSYEFDSGKCVGQATLTIEISVFVFSGSVTIGPVRRQFAGSNGDPSFAALMGPAANDALTDQTEYPWRSYCEAFAA